MQPLALLLLALAAPPVLAQTSTVIAKPTPLKWIDANKACLGTIYPVPAMPTDAVYEVLDAQTQYDKWWIARRGATTCTYLNKNASGLRLEEASCYDLMPFFCKDCELGGGTGCPEH
ncbi:hypothetical protein K4F52_005323 [Lecanicillium sp. MT-2017a]|nr:hypothetical protein K4F52_005323 [Lecanicillium sp. MT-2017a]